MKLSLAWIFDHINYELSRVDVPELLKKFGSTVCEIDDIEKIEIKPDAFTLATVIKVGPSGVELTSKHLGKSFTLPAREVIVGQHYLLIIAHKTASWARIIDIGGQKEGFMPAIQATKDQLEGAFIDSLELHDTIITIDNKAVTHRPDMWSHRGFAREFAAILNAPLVPEEQLVASKPIKHYTQAVPVSSTNPFTIKIESGSCGTPCRRFAGLYFSKLAYQPSLLFYAQRLARIDERSHDLIVDLTNYVMFDMGQPLHAFDAQAMPSHTIVARCAHAGEKLMLLDNQEVALQDTDYVITDGSNPISLAGIMGGKDTAVNDKTTSVFLEAAHFDPSGIRKTATRLKKRTESSARFEKNLDPNQNTQAIERFLHILSDAQIPFEASESISSIGALYEETVISVAHETIVQKLGLQLSQDVVQERLLKLGFGIQLTYDNDNLIYLVTVPTFRATKDVAIPEDIIEEIGRSVGYASITSKLPERAMHPFDTTIITRTHAVKNLLAFGLGMHEMRTYAFFDEDFLREIQFDPQDTLTIQNPQSQNWKRLITSLVPNLFKAIATNKTKQDSLRFFEINHVWFMEQGKPVEALECAGIFYEHKKPVDFYGCKALIGEIFDMLGISVSYIKPDQPVEPWYDAHQTADIVYEGQIVGRLGMASHMLSLVSSGQACMFELDAAFLFSMKPACKKFQPLSKYQDVDLDISMLVGLDRTTNELSNAIAAADNRITDVVLLDFFQKPEWENQKSVTLRFTIVDNQKTLTKEEIDAVYEVVKKEVTRLGAQIR